MAIYAAQRPPYTLSTDPALLDRDAIYHFLKEESYWAQSITPASFARALEHALCFGIYHTGAQAAFARVITDYATFAYVADVFVLAPHRGQGLGKWLMATLRAHPDLQGLRRWVLATRDAHGLYQQFGFVPLVAPERWMEVPPP